MPQASAVLKSEPKSVAKIDIGLDAKYCAQASEALTGILAANYRLLIKTHVYHWNVVGPLFKPLHELTEAQYGALFEAADIIAERIRALGHLAPAKLATAAQFAPKGNDVDHLTAEHIVHDLIADHEAAVKAMRDAAEAAGDARDKVTEDMLTQRLTFHEKALWMLRAIVS